MGLPIWKPREHDDHVLSRGSDESNICRTSRRSHLFSTRHRTPSLLAGSDNRTRTQQATAMANRRSRAIALALRRSSAQLSPLSRQSRSSPAQRREQISDESVDRLLQQRFDEKEDLLNQLEFTATLLDQFLTTRSALGSDSIAIPAFITEDLPAVLASAASLFSSSSSRSSGHEVVDRLLEVPPYSTRLQMLESNIASAHRRIREQLSMLGTSIAEPSSSSSSSSPPPPPPTSSSRPPRLSRTRSFLLSPSPPTPPRTIPLPSAPSSDDDDEFEEGNRSVRIIVNHPVDSSILP